MKKLNWGIVGLGNIAHAFVSDLLLLDTSTIGAVASRSLPKAQLFAKKYGVEKAYGSYIELFNDPEIDIVYIATPHDSHAELSITALEKGKHILCEKPLAVNRKQVQSIVDSAKKNGTFMMEAFWSRFNPSIQKVLELIEEGAIGEVNYVNSDFTFYRDDPDDSRMLNMDLAGGSLLDMGVYPCFLPYLIFGIPEQILATGRFHTTGVDIQTAAIFKYKNGIANMVSGFKSQSDMLARIYGTKGRIYIHPYWHESQGFTLMKGNDGQYETKEYSLPTNGKGFTYEILECMKCVQNGQLESTIWTHQNSLDLITITDKIRRQMGLKYPFE